MPYWELGWKLRYLSLSLLDQDSSGRSADSAEERFEDQINTFELPTQPLSSTATAVGAYAAIANRTIIAAAGDGRALRNLCLNTPWHALDAAFACRNLLPKWVSMDYWYLRHTKNVWAIAAMSLRPALAHVSLWRTPVWTSVPKNDRLLTGADVQAIRFRFAHEGKPKFFRQQSGLSAEPIDRYLVWLEEDAELAQRVADAWNQDVEKVRANFVECMCSKWQGRQRTPEPASRW